MSDRRCLQLFVREPVAGAVKTRLEPRLGRDRTLALYRRMLGHHIALANACGNATRQLWVAGDPAHPDFKLLAGERFVQAGGDIGERMARALHTALADSDQVVLIGCDSPMMDLAYVEQAFAALAAGNDAVLGPAADGGYLLIGLRRTIPDLFPGIDWGTDKVLAQTRSRLAAAGTDWIELAVLEDIDEPADLDRHAEVITRVFGTF